MGTKSSGFASLTPEQRRAICRRGGIAAHASGRAHKFTTAEATAAGKKGGAALAKRGREYFVELGKRGGAASSTARKPKPIACRRDDAGDEKLQTEGGAS